MKIAGMTPWKPDQREFCFRMTDLEAAIVAALLALSVVTTLALHYF